MVRALFGVVLVFALFGLMAPGYAQSANLGPMITGTMSYTSGMALPPNAAIDVRLEDVSLADAPAKLVAENVFALGQYQVPVPFQLPYNASEIQGSHRYAVRANVTVDGNLMFTTTQIYPVLTNGASNNVALTLERVRNTPAQPAAAPNALRGTKWLLIEVDGKPVGSPDSSPAYLVLDPIGKTYSGSTGCNQISGKFQLDGNSLQLLGGAMTMMACPEALMNVEKEFNKALEATGSYQITGITLELLARKKVLARFSAAANSAPGN